eukprot:CAMPEP_0172592814 /NCGR_PEP_ID=MMETSP1068-20121228/11909_1 /TAXON_ID=35684 /ORGANISM="Pseudopedinella elastica, Strain CCMP716" /LENGTH=85 /DNA_ID=CAMNT_0013390027 /DNA_START=57 /DNA_END=312 /DNA_ORIENTATION=-
MGTMWRTFVPEQADDNERNGILKKRKRADSTFASKQAKGLEMTSDENAGENEKNAEREEPSARGDRKDPTVPEDTHHAGSFLSQV